MFRAILNGLYRNKIRKIFISQFILSWLVPMLLAAETCDIELSLVPLKEALAAQKNASETIEKAKKSNVVLTEWLEKPFMAHLQNRHLFYLFYNNVKLALSSKKFLIQRSRRVSRGFLSEGDPNPKIDTPFDESSGDGCYRIVSSFRVHFLPLG